jgi:hypothetical protein
MVKKLFTFILIFCIITISNTLFAQKQASKTIVEDVTFDIDEYVPGGIILLNDSVKSGLVRFNGRVTFQSTGPEPDKRYKAEQLKGFIAGVDTFKVYTDTIEIQQMGHQTSFGKKLMINKDFIKQVIYGSRVCLYKIVIIQGSGGGMLPMGGGMIMTSGGSPTSKNVFYLKRKTENQFTKVPHNKHDFKKVLSAYFKDDANLINDVNTGLLKYDNVDQIVRRYNSKI